MTPGALIPDVLARGVAFLAAAQHPSGSWTDFLLEPGPSDSWVTAYTATALALVARSSPVPAVSAAAAGAAADAAARWLLRTSRDGTWGWNRSVRADADSTAWAVRLLALRGWPVPAQALDFLDSHGVPTGYRTYRNPQVSGSWATPSPEVTAAVLLAQRAAGRLTRPAMARRWHDLVLPARAEDGRWHSMWWADADYPTAVVAAAWAAAGRPALPPATPCAHPTTPWRYATRLWAAATLASPATALPAAGGEGFEELVAGLVGACRPDGGWAGGAELRVPPQRAGGRASWTRDARGVFTTATALNALLAAPVDPPAQPPPEAPRGRVAHPRDQGRAEYDGLVSVMAAAAGVGQDAVLPAFRALTAESLDRPGVWPSRQLSNLAGGCPLEFSVGARPALRLTTEVGDPLLPPHARVRTGLHAVHRAARLLGMSAAWRAVAPAVDALTHADLPVADGCRFWLWAGLDVTPAGRAVLKAYLSLQAEELPGWRRRESAFLDACGVGADAPARTVLDRVAEVGWGHEVGVGLGGGGAWGIKVYYELDGYRPALVRDVLELAGLDADPSALAPEVPGVLRASLAAKRRAGIALRIDPGSGLVTEVTVAAAFPAPLVGRDEVSARVGAWLGATAGPHAGAVSALAPCWRDAPPHAKLHSLFTLSRSAAGLDRKVYLRPWVGGEAGAG